MTYNLTFTENVTSFWDLYRGINDASGGLFTIILMITIAAIVFIATPQESRANVFIATGFLLSLISILAIAAGILTVSALPVPIILLIVGIILKMI